MIRRARIQNAMHCVVRTPACYIISFPNSAINLKNVIITLLGGPVAMMDRLVGLHLVWVIC